MDHSATQHTVIDQFCSEMGLLTLLLAERGELSLQASTSDLIRKSLVLSIASYFEEEIKMAIVDFVRERTSADAAIASLVRLKVIDRQYHTMFDWNAKNANSFFAHFGEEVQVLTREKSSRDLEWTGSIRAFLELGQLRNRLVHQNFVIFPVDKTTQEIYELYRQAIPFVHSVPLALRGTISGASSIGTGYTESW